MIITQLTITIEIVEVFEMSSKKIKVAIDLVGDISAPQTWDIHSYFESKSLNLAPLQKYINNKDFEYNTKSSEKLTDLIKTARQEGYYDKIEESLKQLENQLVGDRNKDLNTFDVEIKGDSLIQQGYEKIEASGIDRYILEKYVRIKK